MTRINLIPVGYLLDQHLLSEYRELPMVMASLSRSIDSPNWPNFKIPKHYTLNTGHVSFFYNKRIFLEDRWFRLIDELRRRGFDVKPEERLVQFHIYDLVPPDDEADVWAPRPVDVQVNLQRILLRVSEKPDWYKYNRQPVTYSWYVKVLSKRGIIK